MKKLALALAGCLVLIAGAAMAQDDESAFVNVKMRGPDGAETELVDYQLTGVPAESRSVGYSEQAGQADDTLRDSGAPLGLSRNSNGLRPNVRCSVAEQDLPSEACIQDEPTVPYADVGAFRMDAESITVSDWVTVDSGQAFSFAGDNAPAEAQEPIQKANEAVGLAADAHFESGSGDPDPGSRLKTPAADLSVDTKLNDLLNGAGFQAGALGEGLEEGLEEGFEQFFDATAPGLDQTSRSGSNAGPAETQSAGSAAGPDLATMAAVAALVGGAILAPMALYHRIRSNHALNNKTRQMVYDAVVRSPGLGVSEAAKAASCSYSTAAYHLERLVEERLLVCNEDGRRARYFKNGGSFSQAEREFVPVLQSPEAMNVLNVIVENPWCYRAEIAQKLGVSGPTVNWHLKRLMKVGVVKEMREGRISYLYADKKTLNQLGANLIGKLPEDQVAKLRFERRPETEMVEPALGLPETTVPEYGTGELAGEVELAPVAESR